MAHDPFWHSIVPGLHLGYRKGARGSSWQARGYDGAKYVKTALGTPDDVQGPDGDRVLSFTQAVAKASAWWTARQREGAGEVPQASPVTVEEACREYLSAFKGRGGKDYASAESRTRLHIIPAFGPVEVAKLTQRQIEKWHHGIAAAPRLYRASKITGKMKAAPAISGAEAVRIRRSSANRILTVLKAVLNRAFAGSDTISTDKAWRVVKPFPAVDAARERFLSEEEASRLLAATSGSFRDLCLAALLTGCRYGEFRALKVRDIALPRSTIYISSSKSGHPRHVHLNEAGLELFGRLVKKRKPDDLVFRRADDAPWRPSDQLRPMAAACRAAKIDPPIGFHGLRHTHASHLVANGVSLQVVASQIGHRSTVMTERHYAHLQPSFVGEQVRANLPKFNIEVCKAT